MTTIVDPWQVDKAIKTVEDLEQALMAANVAATALLDTLQRINIERNKTNAQDGIIKV